MKRTVPKEQKDCFREGLPMKVERQKASDCKGRNLGFFDTEDGKGLTVAPTHGSTGPLMLAG